jgi:beta-lactam-binding protein with PASTA domain
MWLRVYTHHGQKLELSDYIGQNIDIASADAKKKSFKIIASDSTFRVGQPGGLILDQNPKPGTMVKEKRKIYVTITKGIADRKPLNSFPLLYGLNFERKQKELEVQGFNCIIKDYVYDPGEPNHILEVWYKGEKIIDNAGRKENVAVVVGDNLEFVLSKRYGGDVDVPDIRCKPVSEVRYILSASKLKLGEIRNIGNISDLENAWIKTQSPLPTAGKKIQMGDGIDISVMQEKPEECP